MLALGHELLPRREVHLGGRRYDLPEALLGHGLEQRDALEVVDDLGWDASRHVRPSSSGHRQQLVQPGKLARMPQHPLHLELPREQLAVDLPALLGPGVG